MKYVVEYIRDAIAITYKENSIPVFTKKSIADIYNDRLTHDGSKYNYTFQSMQSLLLKTPMRLERSKRPRRKLHILLLERKLGK